MTLEVTVNVVEGGDLRGALRLLEEPLREGEPLSNEFVERLRGEVDGGRTEVLAAVAGGRMLGVLLLAYRLNAAAGGEFASIEDLYVKPESRRQGIGGALVEAVAKRCVSRRVSYVEVQVEEEDVRKFYAALGYELETDVRVLARSYAL